MPVLPHRAVFVALSASLLLVGGVAAAQGAAPGAPDAPAVAPAPAVELDPSADQPIAVLTLQTLDAFEQAEALTVALKRAVDRSAGFSLAKMEKDFALQVLVLSLDCKEPPDAACEQRIADEIKADRFVWGTMKKEGGNVSGQLHLWTRGQGSKATPFSYSQNLSDSADEGLVALAQKHLDEITGGPPRGSITLRVGALNGEVFVDGKEAGKLVAGVANLMLAPGSHQVEVVADGYEQMTTRLDVKSRETREVSLTPVAKPDDGPPYQKIFGVTALGLGAAAAGVATFASIQVLSINSDLEPYKATNIASGKDGCDPGPNGDYPNVSQASSNEVIALCNDGAPMEMLSLVMWPVAGTLAGTGIILLATADWSGDGGVETAALPFEVLPNFGPGGADVSIRVHF